MNEFTNDLEFMDCKNTSFIYLLCFKMYLFCINFTNLSISNKTLIQKNNLE